MDDLIGNMYAVWRIRKRFHINGLLTEPHGDLIKCMISRRDPLEFWSQALGGHLTNSSLEYWCRSPLLSSQPCFITKSASWKPDSSLMPCQPVCGPASLRWLMNIGSDCGSQRGGRGDAPQRPTDLAQSLGGGHFKLSDKLWLCPSAPSPLSLLLTVFCVRQWLSQALPLLRGLSWRLCLRVTFTEISCEINIFQHCLTLFRLCKGGYGVTMYFSLTCPVGHTINVCRFPRFSSSGLATFLCPEVSACFQRYWAGRRPDDRSQGT